MYRLITIICGLVIFCLLSCEHQKEPTYYSYVDALGQIQASSVRIAGLTGKGVKIGIIDLGFATLPSSSATRHLWDNHQLVFQRQYYPDSQAVFFNHSEKHGFTVAFMMGGQSKRDSVYNGGLAVNSTYYLAKVGKSASESKTLSNEEEHINDALNDLYNRGVRLVNISLGYWDDFDDENKNYVRSQMDGKSTRIAKICQKYIDKGMCIVVAAGNTGEFSWRYIWTPGDVEDIITVGACNQVGIPFRASYSGIGNPEVDFVKPDVVCYSAWGTSMSTPIITSLVATMLEKDSTLTPKQIQTILHKAGSLYPYPNNYVGYGIPDAEKVIKLIDNQELELTNVKERYVTADRLELPVKGSEVVLFQKSGPYLVNRQYLITPENGQVVIKRKRGIPRSTVVVNSTEVYEIFWQ